MKKGLIVCLAAAGALMVGCNKEIKSLYGQTLSYQGVRSFLDEKAYGDRTEREYFKDNFNGNINWNETIKKYDSLKDIDQTNVDNALKLISSNLNTEIENLKIGDNYLKNHSFKIGSKDDKKATVNNGQQDKEYTVSEQAGEKFIRLEATDNEAWEIMVEKLASGGKQYTSIKYFPGDGSYTEFHFKYNIMLKNTITIDGEEVNALTIDAVPDFIK